MKKKPEPKKEESDMDKLFAAVTECVKAVKETKEEVKALGTKVELWKKSGKF
jgi:hypothetical protein